MTPFLFVLITEEFTAKAVREWLSRLGTTTLLIKPGCPWENGYCESFNGKLRFGLLDEEIFYNLEEAKILIKNWRKEYNKVMPHSSLGGRPPAPEPMSWVLPEAMLPVVSGVVLH